MILSLTIYPPDGKPARTFSIESAEWKKIEEEAGRVTVTNSLGYRVTYVGVPYSIKEIGRQ